VTDSPAHPLDPLTAEEIRQAAAILRRDRGIGAGWRFASIELKEPGKVALAAGGVLGPRGRTGLPGRGVPDR